MTDRHPASQPPRQTRCRSNDCAMPSRRAGKKRGEAMQTLRAVCSKGDPQTNTQTNTNRQGRLQFTAHLSAQCRLIKERNNWRATDDSMHITEYMR